MIPVRMITGVGVDGTHQAQVREAGTMIGGAVPSRAKVARIDDVN